MESLNETYRMVTNIMVKEVPKWYLEAFNWLQKNQKNILILSGHNCKIAEQCYKQFFRYYDLSYIDIGRKVRLTCKTGKHDSNQFREYDEKYVLMLNVDL